MKSAYFLIPLLLFLAAAFAASAQDDEGSSCWQCPVCGTIFSSTPEEAANVDPYTLCLYCGMSYAGYFIPVTCQNAGFDDYYYDQEPEQETEQGYYQESFEAEGSENSLSQGPLLTQESDQDLSISGTLQPQTILMVVPEKDFQEDELKVARDYFQSSGYQIVLASRGVKTATGMSGEMVSIDQDIQGIDLSPYQAVVFVGGEGIYSLKLHEEPVYQKLAQEAADQGKLIGAICLGPWILADAGLLEGKRATAAETDHLCKKGAVVAVEEVIVDGNIITASGPSAA